MLPVQPWGWGAVPVPAVTVGMFVNQVIDAEGSITSYKNPGQAVAYMLLSHLGIKVTQFHTGIPYLSSFYWERKVDMNVEPHPACVTSDSALHELNATIFFLLARFLVYLSLARAEKCQCVMNNAARFNKQREN